MSKQPQILAFAGSLRKDSLNKKLVRIACRGAELAGAKITYIDLHDYPLPIYDADIETSQGLPENAIKLKELMWKNDGFLIAAPEYNSSVSGVLKNVIDWTSRQVNPQEIYLSCFIDKVVALISASPGALGGLRGLVHLRAIFGNINSLVLPSQKSIPNAGEAFDAQGNLKNPQDQTAIEEIGRKLALTIAKLKS